MIPLKLQIKNFLSYGSKLQTIDFGPYPLICLSGKNGHGKSALLDAMTWAIWGQARKTSGTSKPDAHLLRLGQTSMLVIFDFLFNNQTYRVKREFTATKSGNSYSTVEFGILDATTETFHPLTDKTIRETQKKIECLIGLTFDAFVNTAFLRQGHANEFSKKTPKERKDILASILQLDQYETLRKLTQEEIKKLQEQINHLKFQEEQINTQLQEEQTLVENKATVIRNLETIKQKLDEYQIQLNKLEIQKNALIKKQEEYSLLIYKLDELKKEKVKNEHSLLTLFNEWRTTNKKQHKISNIQEIIQQKELLTQKLFTLQHEQQQILELRERFFKIKELEQQTINNAKEEHLASLKKKEVMIERLNVEHVYLVSKNKELAEQLQLLEQEKNNIGTEQLNVTNHIQKYKELSQQCALIEKQFEKRKNYYHLWVARANSLKQENQGIDQKHLLVKDTSNPSCPLCEQNLSASRKRFLQNKFNKLTKSFEHRVNRLARIIKELKALLIEQHKQLENIKKEQNIYVGAEAQQKELNNLIQKNLTSIVALQNQIKENFSKQENLATLINHETSNLKNTEKSYHTELANNKEYQAYKIEREKIELVLSNKNYQADTYKKILEQLDQLKEQEKKAQECVAEKTKQEQRKKEITQLIASLKIMNSSYQKLVTDIQKYAHLSEDKNKLNATEETLINHCNGQQQQKELLLQEKGLIEHKQQQLEKLKQTSVLHKKNITSLSEQIHEYQILANAFSKDGIQALLIEDAIPEIEQEANELLAKLTYNQAHIIIDSLRDLKKGGTKETLDIKISDPMGIRPYELFSGGEAFRIDFSLRIAISKLLARRAGTSLQTLIIDEGFGSQDEEGLQLLMDAIHKIQDNFSKVIIVSHLTSMKDQFPIHFMIHKGPQGSNINIMEQG